MSQTKVKIGDRVRYKCDEGIVDFVSGTYFTILIREFENKSRNVRLVLTMDKDFTIL